MTTTENLQRTSDFYDVHGDAFNSLAIDFHNFGGIEFFSGSAYTVDLFEDNGLLKTIMQQKGEGRVLVVNGHGSLACTLLGGNMAKTLLDNGWSGTVINGAIRDRDEIAALPFGCLAIGSNPKRSLKDGAGREDITINMGGVDIHPGAMIYADSDGVLVEVKR